MHSIQHADNVNESGLVGLIFDACRNNPERQPHEVSRFGGQRFRVTFTLLANGEHEAAVRCMAGTVLGLAHVDSAD